MAQVWHKRMIGPAAVLDAALDAEAMSWRATKYEVRDIDGRAIEEIDSRSIRGVDSRVVVEAALDATWERFSPFDSYRATGKARALESGPHLIFLRLKRLWENHREGQFRLPDKSLRQAEWFRKHMSHTGPVREILRQSEVFRKALILFTQKYGLLGLFEEYFLGAPVLAGRKTLVAPEAVIDERGRLRRIDPATEGKELLFRLLEPYGHFSGGHLRSLGEIERSVAYETMALPSETAYAPREPHLGGTLWPEETRRLVPWENIRKEFGALMILDERAPDGVSILCTREPLRRWEIGFRFFPSGAPSGEVELDRNSYVYLNRYLEDVSPRALISEDENLERGWRYRSLLQAMYVMLFLDLTGGATIKKCQSRGCPNYFRVGFQSKSIYCSTRCANRASTRMRRGQEP